MLGLMMNTPLLISSLIRHADHYHGDREIVSRAVEGGLHRYTYTQAHRRARQLANALTALGVRPGDRVATLAWNGYRHFEAYYAISGMGAVCHTVNPRLFPEQIAFIINHAEDGYVLFDSTFLKLMEGLAPRCKGVKGYIVMTDQAHMPDTMLPAVRCYEDLLDGHSENFDWPDLDENTASGLCYTSGTTGNPKGVLYSHRATVLHAMTIALPDAMNLSARDCVLPVVPMFHVNAWGIPFTAPLTGAKLVLPGAGLDGANLYELFEREQVTFSGGVAAPPAIIKAFQENHGVQVLHAWGMTEMSPLGVVNTFKAKHASLTPAQRDALQSKQGRPLFGVEMTIVDSTGHALPHDGSAFGDLMVRGPWICQHYFHGDDGNLLRDGWFPTGDVATIDPDGYLQITDRSKDVIKSGGEWISSITLENTAMGHPAVAEVAVIGVTHPKWTERPLLIAVKKSGMELTKQELLQYFAGKVEKWWIPDDAVFVEQLPHTATGKLLKTKLREEFKAYRLPLTRSAAEEDDENY